MRLFELEQDGVVYTPAAIKKLAAWVKQHCQPWLAAAGPDRVVYRGIKYEVKSSKNQPMLSVNPAAAFVRTVRTNRRSLNTRKLPHQWFNHIIKLAGGVANRSNSAFVINDLDVASQYGQPYAFIPVGNFHYTWHTRWDDWYTALNAHAHDSYLLDEPQLLKVVQSKMPELNVTEVLDSWANEEEAVVEFTYMLDGRTLNDDLSLTPMQAMNHKKAARDIRADRGLTDAIKAQHEIMIKSDSGLYVDWYLVDELARYLR